jgi:HAD superfamily hydrolase (TIGR01484 family)
MVPQEIIDYFKIDSYKEIESLHKKTYIVKVNKKKYILKRTNKNEINIYINRDKLPFKIPNLIDYFKNYILIEYVGDFVQSDSLALRLNLAKQFANFHNYMEGTNIFPKPTLKEFVNKIQKSLCLFDNKFLDKGVRIFLEMLPKLYEKVNTLEHGDPYIKNIKYTNQLDYVFDWESSQMGTGLSDLVRISDYEGEINKKITEFYKRYRKVENFENMFMVAKIYRYLLVLADLKECRLVNKQCEEIINYLTNSLIKEFKILGNKYNMLILDLDNTICDNNLIISEKLKVNIKNISKKYKICLSTGRSAKDTLRILNELGIKYISIVEGGILINNQGEKIFGEYIDDFCLKNILEKIRTINCNKMIVCSNGEDKIFNKKDRYNKVSRISILGIQDRDVKLIKKNINLKILRTIKYKFNGLSSFDIMPKINSKKSALNKMFEIYNQKATDVIYIGDGENDLDAFEAVGLKIAMGNSILKLKEKADIICPCFEDEGVNYVIEKIL